MWLAEHAQEIARVEMHQPLARLSGVIEIALAEMDDGLGSEDELKTAISAFLAQHGERSTKRERATG